jgi:uncharacterized protein
MTSERAVLVRYRLERARESLAEARLLLQAGHPNTVVNRLYYACFYAASAALLGEGKSASTHSGLRALLHQQLVKPGVVPIDLGRVYDTLFDNRQKGDYADLVRFEVEAVRGWLPQAERLVHHLIQVTEGLLPAEGTDREQA